MIDTSSAIKPTIRAHYSLIQFCPDAARLEAANVGVAVFCAERQYFGIKLSNENRRITQMFGRGELDLVRLRTSKRALEELLLDSKRDLRNLEDLNKLAALQVNQIRMTKFMPCRITAEPENDLVRLFEELVGVKGESSNANSSKTQLLESLERQFSERSLQRFIRRDVQIMIPAFKRETTIPYAYQNGRLNLISPVVFPQKESALEDRAARFAVEGESIYEHEHERYGKMQLLVVGAFQSKDPEQIDKATEILNTHKVLLFRNDQLAELADEIKTHGHERNAS